MKVAGKALLVVLFFGLTSLFGDLAYEGFRSALSILVEKAGGGWVELGGVIGLGEILNWGLRLATGALADALGAYWAITFAGYALTPIGILVATMGQNIGLVALGVGLERLGKAVRSPARDALLAGLEVEEKGIVFGLHELLDQVGAVGGPLLAYLLLVEGAGLYWLALPGALTVVFLALAKTVYPSKTLYAGKRERIAARMTKITLVSAILALTIVHPVVLVYAGQARYSMGETAVLLYLAAMLVDAAVAVPLGAAWDRYGSPVLLSIPLAGLAGVALLYVNPWAAAAATGAALAGTETVLKAYVARETGEGERGIGYGSMALGLGVGMAASGILYSFLVSL